MPSQPFCWRPTEAACQPPIETASWFPTLVWIAVVLVLFAVIGFLVHVGFEKKIFLICSAFARPTL